MLKITRFRIVRGMAIPALLFAAPHVLSVAAEQTTLSLEAPKSIGDLRLDEVRKPTEDSRSTQLVYKAPGMTLTLYIFGSKPDPPDGIESDPLQTEFKQAKEAIQDPRAWKRAKQVTEGTVQLGTPPHLFVAREAVFNVKSDNGSATSYLYLTAARGLFFKVRYTVFRKQRKIGEAQLPYIREAVGEVIEKVIEQRDGAT